MKFCVDNFIGLGLGAPCMKSVISRVKNGSTPRDKKCSETTPLNMLPKIEAHPLMYYTPYTCLMNAPLKMMIIEQDVDWVFYFNSHIKQILLKKIPSICENIYVQIYN